MDGFLDRSRPIPRLGGMHGRGLLELQARATLHPSLHGGSGARFVDGGGGSFTVLAMGSGP
jgi:hypothetical protein